MALLGSTVDPRLFVQDYSGFVDAAKIQAQGMMGLGQSIGDIGKMYAERKKEQAGQEKEIKIASSIADAIEKTMPELVPNIGEIKMQLMDKNSPIGDRHAKAQSIMEILNLGLTAKELQMKQQAFNLRASAKAPTAAPSPAGGGFNPHE